MPDLERKMGFAGIGRYKSSSQKLTGVQRGAVFLPPKSVEEPIYEDSAFQTLEPQSRHMALAKAKAKASMWAKKFTNAVARRGFSIKTASREEHVEHSEQFPLNVKIDNDGKVANGGVVTQNFLPNLYLHELPADTKHSIMAQALKSTSLSPFAKPPQPIPALESSPRESIDEPTNTWESSSAYASDTDAYVVHDASCSPPQSKTTEKPAALEPSCNRKDTPHDADAAEPTDKRTKSERPQPKALDSRQAQGAHSEHVETQAKTQARGSSRTRQNSRAQSPERGNKHSRQKDDHSRNTGERQDDLRRARDRSMSPARHDSTEYRDRKASRNMEISKVESLDKRNKRGSSKQKDDHARDTVDRHHATDKGRHRSKSPVRRSRSPVRRSKSPARHRSSGYAEYDTSRTRRTSRAQSPEKRSKHGSSKKKDDHACDTVDRRHDSYKARHNSRSPVRRSRSPIRNSSSGYGERDTKRPTTAQSSERRSKNESSGYRDNDMRNGNDKVGYRQDPYGSRHRSRSPVHHDSSSSNYRDRNESRRTRGRSSSPTGRNTLSDTRARHGKDSQADKKRATQASKMETGIAQTILPRAPQGGEFRVRGIAKDITDVPQAEGFSVRGAARNVTTVNSTSTPPHTSTPALTVQNTSSNTNGGAQAESKASNQGMRNQKRSREAEDPHTESGQGQLSKRAKTNPEPPKAVEDPSAKKKREFADRVRARHANDKRGARGGQLYRPAGRR
jgi:hypothetical protein